MFWLIERQENSRLVEHAHIVQSYSNRCSCRKDVRIQMSSYRELETFAEAAIVFTCVELVDDNILVLC